MPVLCQHCAKRLRAGVPHLRTYNNPEGLNVQVYNRCVGTFYCANNCPYTVPTFNWSLRSGRAARIAAHPDVAVRPAA